MAIVTPDDLRDRFGPEIDRLADRNGDGSADAGVIEAAIADAEAEVTAVIGLTALLSGCVASGGAIDPAICASPVETLARDHARALVADGGPTAVVSGRRLLGALKAGCGWR